MQQTRFTFKLIHWFLTGIERGMYDDNSLSIGSDCFGDYYVQKLNEYEYLWQENPFGDFFQNVFPEISLTYQFYYMITNDCDVDKIVNDYMVFCWYRGCWPEQMLSQVENKFLYILRAVNDAAIVWYEGVPANKQNLTDAETKQWINLAEQTGQTTSNIFKDLTGFYPVPKDQRK